MTTKQHEPAVDTGKYLNELSDRAWALMQDLEHLNDEFELTPHRHRVLDEVTQKLFHLSQTIQELSK